MDKLKSFINFQTDINGSWGIGQTTKPITLSFQKALDYAISKKAYALVKPSRGKFWYIKGINNNKSYNEIKEHIENNLNNNYKPKSNIWLLEYKNE